MRSQTSWVETVAKILKPSSEQLPPDLFPVIEPLGSKARRRFPSALLSNAHCISKHGRGLANMADRGGFGVEEIASNIMRTIGEGALPSRATALFIIREALRANGYDEQEINQWRS